MAKRNHSPETFENTVRAKNGWWMLAIAIALVLAASGTIVQGAVTSETAPVINTGTLYT